MASVVLDAGTLAKLRAAANGAGGVEVRDEAGNLVGRFLADGPPVPPDGYEIVGEWPSDEEIDRRMREDKRYTAAEVEAFLMGLRRATR